MPSSQLLIIAAALAASAIDSEILEINKYSKEQNVSQKVSNTRLNEKHLEKESTERMQEPLPAKSILPSAFSSQIVSELTPCAVYPRGVECYERKERFEYSTSRKRHIVHVSTDKQTYRPGEIVYIRAVVIGALNFKPVGDKTTWGTVLKIMCPIGSVAYEVLLSDIKDSVMSTIWAIPRDVAGGEYQIEIFNKKEFSPRGLRSFIIRSYRQPAFSVSISFISHSGGLAGGYGYGDLVRGRVEAIHTSGGACGGAKIVWSASLEGERLDTNVSGPSNLDDDGVAEFSLRLPLEGAADNRGGGGEGWVAVTVQYGGDVEGQAKTIPMVLHKINLAMYPEVSRPPHDLAGLEYFQHYGRKRFALIRTVQGGELVTGLKNRVYFEGRTRAGEPVALEAELWELDPQIRIGSNRLHDHSNDGSRLTWGEFLPVPRQDRKVCSVIARHEGRGEFTFTPAASAVYEVRLIKPAGVEAVAVPQHSFGPGIVLHSAQGVFAAGEPVKVELTALGDGRTLIVVAYRREVELSRVVLAQTQHGLPEVVSLELPPAAAGVIRVTVYEKTQDDKDWVPVERRPLAERLIFRDPPRALAVSVSVLRDPAWAGHDPGSTQSASNQPCTGKQRGRNSGSDTWVCVGVTDAATGLPVPGAVVGAAVTDAANSRLVERRRQHPLLPAMVFLEGEVQSLDDAAAYLPPTEPAKSKMYLNSMDPSDKTEGEGARQRLDLLLGTQGWRRFLYIDPLRMAPPPGDEVGAERDALERMLGLHETQGAIEEMNRRAEEKAKEINRYELGGNSYAVPALLDSWYDINERWTDSGKKFLAKYFKSKSPADQNLITDGDLNSETLSKHDSTNEASNILWQSLSYTDSVNAPFPLSNPNNCEMEIDNCNDDSRNSQRNQNSDNPKQNLAFVRVFARRTHAVGCRYRQSMSREEDGDTVFWAAGLITDSNGEAMLSFSLADRGSTAYRVVVEAHSPRVPAGSGDEQSLLQIPAFGASDSVPLFSNQPLKVQRLDQHDNICHWCYSDVG